MWRPRAGPAEGALEAHRKEKEGGMRQDKAEA